MRRGRFEGNDKMMYEVSLQDSEKEEQDFNHSHQMDETGCENHGSSHESPVGEASAPKKVIQPPTTNTSTSPNDSDSPEDHSTVDASISEKSLPFLGIFSEPDVNYSSRDAEDMSIGLSSTLDVTSNSYRDDANNHTPLELEVSANESRDAEGTHIGIYSASDINSTSERDVEHRQSGTSTPSVQANTDIDVEDTVQVEAASVFHTTPSHLSPEDENVLKYFVILRPTGPAAKVLAKVCITLYQGGQQSVKDYYLTGLSLNNIQYRRAFTTHERELLEKNFSWDSFDITFLYKLLQRVCGLAPSFDKNWAEPEPQNLEELEHQLYLVKCERNSLAHETVTLTNLELNNRVQRLRSSLEMIFCKLGIKKNADYSTDASIMNLKLDEILNTMPQYSLQSYQKELEELRRSIVDKLIMESQTELFSYYLNLWSSRQAWWFQLPRYSNDRNAHHAEELFTDMTIIDMEGLDLEIKDLFVYQTSKGCCPRVMIIEGIAGIGKSHICKYILFKWASKEGGTINLNGVDILIFIQCYSVTSKSLREFLTEELLQNTCSTLRHNDVIPALQKCEVMFVIDGLDEAGSNVKAIIKELSKKFPNNRVLITCRPESTEAAKNFMLLDGENVCTFFAKGFNNEQQSNYLNKLLTVLKVDANDQGRTSSHIGHKIHELNEDLNTLLSLPLTVTMLVLLWYNDNDSLSLANTVTRIHQQTIDMKVKQLAQRVQRKSGENRHISIIERLCHKWLLALSRVAWETLQRDTQILDDDSVNELIEEASNQKIDPIDALSSFLKYTVLERMCQTIRNWEFFHKAFQEYLTALYLNNTRRSDFPRRKSPEILHFQAKRASSSSGSSYSPFPLPNDISNTGVRYRGSFSCSSLFRRCCCFWKKRASKSKKISGHDPSVEKNYLINFLLPEGNGSSVLPLYTDAAPLTNRLFHPTPLPFRAHVRNEEAFIRRKTEESTNRDLSNIHYHRGGVSKQSVWSEDSWSEGASGEILRDSESEASIYIEAAPPTPLPPPPLPPGEILKGEEYDICTYSGDPPPPLPPRPPPFSRFLKFSSSRDKNKFEYSEDLSNQMPNTLQFLGAIEASKDQVDYEYMKEIMMRFDRVTSSNSWESWAAFLRECAEKPLVCQLLKEILQNKSIEINYLHSSRPKLNAIEYLLRKTEFQPSLVKLLLTNMESVPDVINSLLFTVKAVSPGTVIDLKCNSQHSSQ